MNAWKCPSARVAFLLLATSVAAQVRPSGSVEGTVKDSSGAVIRAARIAIINVETGISRSTATNDLGQYIFPIVPPGPYRLEAELEGFQKYVQEFRVQTGIASTVDVLLQVGEVKQVTEVKAQIAAVEAASATLSAVITNRQVTDLPLAGRNPYELILLSPGIVQTYTPRASDMQDVDLSYFSTNGANSRQNDFLMDGVPNNIADRVAYIPPVDQVEEFNVQTNTFDAEYGHVGGAVINLVTKSGTNQFHGSVYEFLRNSALDANNFFNNQLGVNKPPFRFNQFGGTLGGRIVPNHTFFFFNYEGIRTNRPSLGIATVPTDLQRSGNFSQTFDARGQLIRIFDPFTTRQDPANPSRFIRDQFPGNVLPSARFDPVSKNLLAYLPGPNRAGDGPSGINNYVRNLAAIAPMNDVSVRVDHELTSRNRLFGRYSREVTATQTDYLIDIGGVRNDKRVQYSIGLGNTFTISSATILDVSAGYSYYARIPFQPGADMVKLGFPAAFVALLQQQKVPSVGVTDMTSFGATEGDRYDITPTFSFQANMRHITGRHSIKWGFQTQVKRNNAVPGGRPAGTYSFDRGFTQGPDPTAKATNVGYGMASFLLGTPASGYVDLNADDAAQSPYYGTYFQDDIHVSQRLTLNVGLRYELLMPSTDRFNRINTGFDYSSPNPIQAAAQAAYGKSPIPELALQNFVVPGGLMFADSSHRRSGITDKTNFSPRFGLAYRLNDKTVFRGGFGVFYTYWWSPFVRQLGFSSQTPYVASVDGITPANVLSNPFPNGLAKPIGSSQGLATLLGATINFYDQYRMQPYNERWSLGLQRQLSRDLRLEANYVGQTAFRLPLGSGGQEQDRELHYLPAQYLSLGNRLFQTVPNPFYGLIPSTSALGAKTISVQNLLSTYPEFTSVDVTRQTQGKSYYHSLQVVATKSMSHGIQILGTYTFSKLLEKVRLNDVTDPGPAKQIGEFDRPQRITLGAVMELPFGPGKSLVRSGWMAKVAGGWQVNVVQIFQSGDATAISPAVMATGIDPRVDPGQRTPNYWFNPGAFVTLPAFTARTLPYRLARLRSDAIANWDLSLVKDTVLTERVKMQFRWEAFNAFNRCQLGAPNLDPRSSNYNRILSQANSPRDMQFALKLKF